MSLLVSHFVPASQQLILDSPWRSDSTTRGATFIISSFLETAYEGLYSRFRDLDVSWMRTYRPVADKGSCANFVFY
jgi:hypothetical protein